MGVFYNGMELRITKVLEMSRVPVYHHGNKLLYVRHRVIVQAVLNPSATSYVYPGVAGAVVENKAGVGRFQNTTVANLNDVRGAGQAGSKTEVNILHALTTPRRLLVITTEALPGQAEVEWLVSPPRRTDVNDQYFTTDATNGPVSLGAKIIKRHANKTLEVECGWQTDIAACHAFSTTPPSVISHTWKMTRITDQDAFSKRQIEGELLFRKDRLTQLAAEPDDFVSFIAHPCPVNMHLIGIETYPSEDNTRCAYRVVDQERPLNLINWSQYNVTRIEAYHNFGYASTSFLEKAVDMAEFAWQKSGRATSAAVGLVGGTMLKDPRMFMQGLDALGGALMSPREGFDLYRKIAPKTSFSVAVKVWGNRNATRRQLARVANRVIGGVVGGFASAASTQLYASTALSVGEDLMGKYVEAKLAMEGGVALLLQRLGGVTWSDIGSTLHTTDEIANISTRSPAKNPELPFGNNTRGTWLGRLVSQALKAPCDSYDAFLIDSGDPGQFRSVPLAAGNKLP